MFLVPAVTCFLTWLFNQTEELELKAEVEKLKLDQALENVRREKARQRQEQCLPAEVSRMRRGMRDLPTLPGARPL